MLHVCVDLDKVRVMGFTAENWKLGHRHLFHSKNICPLLFLTSR
jgi:hypothetical protein